MKINRIEKVTLTLMKSKRGKKEKEWKAKSEWGNFLI